MCTLSYRYSASLESMCIEKVSGEKAAEQQEDCEEMQDVPMEDRCGKAVVLSALGQHLMCNHVRLHIGLYCHTLYAGFCLCRYIQ